MTPPMMPAHDANAARRVYLLPGAYHCTPEPTWVSTVLGSCVAVCLTDRGQGLSGINHFVLPRANSQAPCLRYGDVSIHRLVEAMLDFGCAVHDLEAKVFGGAAVLATSTRDNIGAQNIQLAVECLRLLDIPIVARCTGGKTGYSVRLFTGSGEVLVRRIASTTACKADKRAFGAPA